MYVTDTHSFIKYLTEDKELGKAAENIFISRDNMKEIIIIPAIVLIEAMYICEKKKTVISFDQVLEKLRISSNYQVFPLDERIVLVCRSMKLSDPHDRIIVATSKLLNCPVITKDDEIKNSRVVETI